MNLMNVKVHCEFKSSTGQKLITIIQNTFVQTGHLLLILCRHGDIYEGVSKSFRNHPKAKELRNFIFTFYS